MIRGCGSWFRVFLYAAYCGRLASYQGPWVPNPCFSWAWHYRRGSGVWGPCLGSRRLAYHRQGRIGRMSVWCHMATRTVVHWTRWWCLQRWPCGCGGGSWHTDTLSLICCAAATVTFISDMVSVMPCWFSAKSKSSWFPPATIITCENFSSFFLWFSSIWVTICGVAPLAASTLVFMYRLSSRSRMMELPMTRTGSSLGGLLLSGTASRFILSERSMANSLLLSSRSRLLAFSSPCSLLALPSIQGFHFSSPLTACSMLIRFPPFRTVCWERLWDWFLEMVWELGHFGGGL